MWAIYDVESDGWVKELPSKVDDGGIAILCFADRKDAEQRAAKHYGYDSYNEAYKDKHCAIVKVT